MLMAVVTGYYFVAVVLKVPNGVVFALLAGFIVLGHEWYGLQGTDRTKAAVLIVINRMRFAQGKAFDE
ncbi:hypothetical protein GCM10027341_41250 [Spirosoma knui]